MKQDLITKLHTDFEAICHQDEEIGTEFWLARELQPLLGYTQYRNFEPVIEKAMIACENSGQVVGDHFASVRKMVDIGSGAQRGIEDIALSRYACYLVAQNGDASKEPIAFAQTYFAVQTRKMEIIEQRLLDVERLNARKKLTESERVLSGIIFERLADNQSFARIRSKGDSALFGGKTTQQMKDRMGVGKSRPLADFLPTITIKAKDFANEITNFNIKKDDLRTEASISKEHVKNNRDVRNVLTNRGIVPENLPPEEDLRKVERRLASEEKKLPKSAEKLEHKDDEADED
jgi:DNA-damage-inducible protein D